MIEIRTMDNGVRVVMEPMENVRSAAVGVWVNTGSVRETAGEAGASHFIEHMVFKGTERRNAQQIAIEMDAVGGNLNAFTSKECTCYYAKVLDEHLPIAVDLLSDIVLHSVFDSGEMDKERGVILEEILMTEDSPEDLVSEEANSVFFGEDPLAKPILGTKESVSGFTRESLLAYRDKHYGPGNLVIACAGSFEQDKLYGLLTEQFGGLIGGGASAPLPQGYPGGKRTSFIKKDVEQVHINLMLPGFSRDDQYPLAVLSNIIGGGTSSRLFQSIREQRGLAYSIYSYPVSYTATGSFSLYAGTGDKQALAVTELMLEELDRIRREGVTEEELIRCREQLKGGYLLGMESTGAQMNAIGKELLLQKREYHEENVLSNIECVRMEDIQRIIPVCLDPENLCAAFVGRVEKQRDKLQKLLN